MASYSTMHCCIDEIIKKYLYTTINNIQLKEEDIQELLDNCREILNVSAVYVMEGLATNSGFEVSMESRDDETPSIKGMISVAKEADYKKARAMYDEDFIRIYETSRSDIRGTVLSYGLFHDGDYDGSVCFMDQKVYPKVWSEDEIRAVKKMGRALHRQVMIQRMKKIDKDRERQHEEMIRTLEEAKEATQAKSFFLFNMSHDIRTPMNAIIGFTQMARKNIDDKEKALDSLAKLETSSKYMLRILDDVLDMAKIDQGKMELEVEVIDIYALCKRAEDVFRDSMEEKNLTFIVHNDIQETYIVSDAHRLKQVVSNLLSNAMKYTKSGGTVQLFYTQLPCQREGYAKFEIRVKDTGIGISKGFQEHLFEAFERERTATKSGVQGTGLGLAIAKRITDMMGGTLVCNSELGKGTEFIFTFEACKADTLEEHDMSWNTSNVLKGKRALIVEDNDLNREIAIDMLTDLNVLCEEASDGAIAVDMIRNSTPGYYDFVLMDIQMPYMDGYQATREIRLLKDQRLAQIPIIAMTANAFEEDREKAIQAQMNEHLAKPVDIQIMIKTLQDVLGL